MNVHTDCGKGDESGPFEHDCSCRDTVLEDTCAQNGCGFCRRSFSRATGHFDPLPERGIPSTAMRGCDMRFWKRTHRAMPRHNWKHLQGLGLTEGGAIVFLAVPREVPDTLPLGKKG